MRNLLFYIILLIFIATVNGSIYLQSSFNGGELSPLLYGRVDTESYYSGAVTCENIIGTVEGNAQKRPGTYFISDLVDVNYINASWSELGTASNTRLLPFTPSNTDAYILSLGHESIGFYKEQ